MRRSWSYGEWEKIVPGRVNIMGRKQSLEWAKCVPETEGRLVWLGISVRGVGTACWFLKLVRSVALILYALVATECSLSKKVTWCVFKKSNRAIEISSWYYWRKKMLLKEESDILRKQRKIDQNIMHVSKWSANSDEIFKDSFISLLINHLICALEAM